MGLAFVMVRHCPLPNPWDGAGHSHPRTLLWDHMPMGQARGLLTTGQGTVHSSFTFCGSPPQSVAEEMGRETGSYNEARGSKSIPFHFRERSDEHPQTRRHTSPHGHPFSILRLTCSVPKLQGFSMVSVTTRQWLQPRRLNLCAYINSFLKIQMLNNLDMSKEMQQF